MATSGLAAKAKLEGRLVAGLSVKAKLEERLGKLNQSLELIEV